MKEKNASISVLLQAFGKTTLLEKTAKRISMVYCAVLLILIASSVRLDIGRFSFITLSDAQTTINGFVVEDLVQESRYLSGMSIGNSTAFIYQGTWNSMPSILLEDCVEYSGNVQQAVAVDALDVSLALSGGGAGDGPAAHIAYVKNYGTYHSLMVASNSSGAWSSHELVRLSSTSVYHPVSIAVGPAPSFLIQASAVDAGQLYFGSDTA